MFDHDIISFLLFRIIAHGQQFMQNIDTVLLK